MKWFFRAVLAVMLVVAIMGSVTQSAFADGCKFPPVAIKEFPKIPVQRAVLAFKEGEETLVIESSLDGEGEEFAWIIPVPATPTKFEEASPGLIKTLALVTRPQVIERSKGEARLRVVAILVGLWAIAVLILKPKTRLTAAILLVICVLLSVLFTPIARKRQALDESGPTVDLHSAAGVRVEKTVTVGSYDLAVLDVDNRDALNKWLTQSGFVAVPKNGEDIVDDYVASEWRFVAAKLRREGSGFSRPHPLSMTFPTEELVYPMRLTALADSEVYLELFVIADKTPEHALLQSEFSDSYSFDPEGGDMFLWGGYGWGGHHDVFPIMNAENTYATIGHPRALELMWDDCVLTRLSGTLSPVQMDQDFMLHLADRRPHRKRMYTETAAALLSLKYAYATWFTGLPLLILLNYRRITGRRGDVWAICVIIPALLLLSATVFGAVRSSLPETTGYSLHKYTFRGPDSSLMRDLVREVAAKHDSFRGWTPERIGSTFIAELESRSTQDVYPEYQPVIYEDSPGNFTVYRDDRGVVFRWYDMRGAPMDVVVEQKKR